MNKRTRSILVIDIGGTNVKLMISPTEKRKFSSGKALSPRQLVSAIKTHTADWNFDRIAIGFPSPVSNGEIVKDPKHLAKGWVGFDFRKAFAKPVRVINDAAMQALGSYHGRRMLFLGLGTGLGSALIWDRNVLPLELGDLPYPDVARIEDVVGKTGLEEMGRKVWRKEVLAVIERLKLAFIADYVVVGGGNAKQFEALPDGFELGHNRHAFRGGVRLWETETGGRRPKWNIIG